MAGEIFRSMIFRREGAPIYFAYQNKNDIDEGAIYSTSIELLASEITRENKMSLINLENISKEYITETQKGIELRSPMSKSDLVGLAQKINKIRLAQRKK